MVMTEKVIRKLDEAFLFGLSDRQACKHADIPYSTFCSWLEKNEDYRVKKEMLKQNPKIRAQINICKSIDSGNIEDSKWYLERKGKDDGFSTKQEISSENINHNNNTNVTMTIEQKRELLQKLIDEQKNKDK